MKSILCYGDSNTWGYIPASRDQRYPRNVRWTGILQELLGPEYYVIEEGLSGRTTCLDDPTWPGRNGYKTLYNTMESHYPVDLVLIMLGSNDSKRFFSHEPQVCCAVMEEYAKLIRKSSYGPDGKDPEILVVSPLYIDPEHVISPSFDPPQADAFIRRLAPMYKRYADMLGLHFYDASPITMPDPADGLHMSPEGHALFAKTIKEVILDIIG